MDWATALKGWAEPKYHVLEAFGASQRLKSAWKSAGFSGVSFDIKLAARHDLCTEQGVKTLLSMAMESLVLHCLTYQPLIF